MSEVLIHEYLNDLQDLRKVSGSTNESNLKDAFARLLRGYGRARGLIFVREYEIETPAKRSRYVDGALLHELRVPFGYWEAKDEKDDLDAEIVHKFKAGYPQDNILFEDNRQAVLVQNGREAMRCSVEDVKELAHMLDVFFDHERPEIMDFRRAVEQFREDIPAVLNTLREMITKALAENLKFRHAAKKFLDHAREAINSSLTDDDVREMLIQHVLTEEIFSKVFGEDDFHRQNNVAKELYALEGTFFTGDLKKRTLKALDSYYAAIRSAAARIGSHHEKQTFLKVIYENFYKVYNPQAADRLGVVYTPNEVVRFMIESADWLCDRHFDKNMIDKDVEILDPAVGTGTFICELLEHFRGQPKKLAVKYKEDLHANEVAILPYYVANLNIEATYAAIAGQYEEFPNLCFVDTLDNIAGLRVHSGGKQLLPGGISEENVARIDRQNKRKISVVIGNPPYNANQLNENDNNKNRAYPNIDTRIKETYIAASTAQKTKLYDMYARFFRWASDRLAENGVLAFITNRSFIDSRTFDGFRKVVAEEFNEVWIVDLGGDVRSNPKLSGTKNNVFGIQTGVAISFLVKKAKTQGCRIFYARRPELETREEKLAFLASAKLHSIPTEEIRPDKNHNWINLTRNDFDSLIPLLNQRTKSARREVAENAICRIYSNGVVTARDEWLNDFSETTLRKKAAFFINLYNNEQARWASRRKRLTLTEKGALPQVLRDFVSREIKWTEELEGHLDRGTRLTFQSSFLRKGAYRPFVATATYYSHVLTHRVYMQDSIFPISSKWDNKAIGFSGLSSTKPFQCLVVDRLPSFDLLEKTQFLPLYQYDGKGQRVSNITYWAFERFSDHYQKKDAKPARAMSQEAIFYYVYGVLHDPVYREKYAQNLKREFPRIPFYPNFWQWADWGRALMDLHLGYETVAPYALKRTDVPDEMARNAGIAPRTLLKADKIHGVITLDTETTLGGVPPEAWLYKLGSRCALEWILDQYKERKAKDPTIREKFNTYRFADYKEEVIDLLARITTVSVQTVAITEAMKKAPR